MKVDQKQINALADAILRLLEWRRYKMQLRQEAKIKRMIKHQARLQHNLVDKPRTLFDQ